MAGTRLIRIGAIVPALAIAAVIAAAGPAIAKTDAATNTYTNKKTCPGAHSKQKGTMKDAARRFCVQKKGSSGLNILKGEKYTKVSCQKKKAGTKVKSVRVSGRLKYNCK